MLLAALLLVTAGCARFAPKSESPAQPDAPAAPDAAAPVPETTAESLAVYLGVEGYGSLDAAQKDAFRYRFFRDGETVLYTIAPDSGVYAVQNLLEEGGVYVLDVRDGVITGAREAASVSGAVTQTGDGTAVVAGKQITCARVWRIEPRAGGAFVSSSALQTGESASVWQDASGDAYVATAPAQFTPVVSGTPGECTLKNFLTTALMPAGTTLYVYGGAWNWQDTAASRQARSIGVPQQWVDFFRSQDASYTYKSGDAAHSYYPFGRWNEYYFAGADCSGFVGWALYNTFETADGAEGYVWYASDFTQELTQRGFGAQTASQSLCPGDIMSMSGHVWISLGSCSDGSAVIVHSTPDGGVQLSALGSGASCEAYRLAQTYMARLSPEWTARYPVLVRSPGQYLSADGGSGLFRWDTQSAQGLSDPDGLQQMQASEVLRVLFGEAQ